MTSSAAASAYEESSRQVSVLPGEAEEDEVSIIADEVAKEGCSSPTPKVKKSLGIMPHEVRRAREAVS